MERKKEFCTCITMLVTSHPHPFKSGSQVLRRIHATISELIISLEEDIHSRCIMREISTTESLKTGVGRARFNIDMRLVEENSFFTLCLVM